MSTRVESPPVSPPSSPPGTPSSDSGLLNVGGSGSTRQSTGERNKRSLLRKSIRHGVSGVKDALTSGKFFKDKAILELCTLLEEYAFLRGNPADAVH